MQDILPPAQVVCDLHSTGKKQLFQEIASQVGAVLGISNHSIFEVLWEREQLGTTGVGQGIAIPHGKLAGLDGVHGFFVRLAEPVDFGALDEKPVDLVFALLAPAASGADHLEALGQISKILRDAQFCGACRQAKNATAIHGLFLRQAEAKAA